MLLLFFTTDAGAAAAVGRKETDDIAMWILLCIYVLRVRDMSARVKKREERKRFFTKNPKLISHTSNITEERARRSQESTRERRSDVYFSPSVRARTRAPRHSFLRE